MANRTLKKPSRTTSCGQISGDSPAYQWQEQLDNLLNLSGAQHLVSDLARYKSDSIFFLNFDLPPTGFTGLYFRSLPRAVSKDQVHAVLGDIIVVRISVTPDQSLSYEQKSCSQVGDEMDSN